MNVSAWLTSESDSPTPASNWRPNGNGSPTSSNGCWTSGATTLRSSTRRSTRRRRAGTCRSARVSRAIAERDRDQAAVHRRHDAARRADTLSSRAGDLADTQELHGEELSWAAERESFVAHERVPVGRCPRRAAGRPRRARRSTASSWPTSETSAIAAGSTTRTPVTPTKCGRRASGARARTARAHADLQEIRETAHPGNVTPQRANANTTARRTPRPPSRRITPSSGADSRRSSLRSPANCSCLKTLRRRPGASSSSACSAFPSASPVVWRSCRVTRRRYTSPPTWARTARCLPDRDGSGPGRRSTVSHGPGVRRGPPTRCPDGRMWPARQPSSACAEDRYGLAVPRRALATVGHLRAVRRGSRCVRRGEPGARGDPLLLHLGGRRAGSGPR